MRGLDEVQHARLNALYVECLEGVKRYREATGVAVTDVPMDEMYAPMIDAYVEMGGELGTSPEEILKHARSRFGPACVSCGKELQTTRANVCAECGHLRVS